MKTEESIPESAASRNLKLSITALTVAVVLATCKLPIWLILLFSGISGGFLLFAVYCVLDIQEFKMKQNQKIIELLMENKNA